MTTTLQNLCLMILACPKLESITILHLTDIQILLSKRHLTGLPLDCMANQSQKVDS